MVVTHNHINTQCSGIVDFLPIANSAVKCDDERAIVFFGVINALKREAVAFGVSIWDVVVTSEPREDRKPYTRVTAVVPSTS